MLAPGNYVQWKSRIKRYIDTKPNHELIHYCLEHPPYKFKWAKRKFPVTDGSLETTTEGYMDNYKNVSQDIRNQLDAEAEVVLIILLGIDNDIYSTVDACPNACEMWKAIERLKLCESINVQDLELNPAESKVKSLSALTHKLYDILKQHQNEVNEIRAKRLARTANPLALVAQQQPVYHPQPHLTHYTQNSSTRSQQAATRNRGKEIVNSPPPTYDQQPDMVTEDDALSKEKEIDKLMASISQSCKKIYKPTNNNLRTSSNTSRANQDNTSRTNRGTGYDNQRAVNVFGARENVARECQKPKQAKDVAYHKEKMLLFKQEEVGVQFSAKQVDWRDDTDDKPEDQELEAHYLYMEKIQEVTPDAADNPGPIVDVDPLQKVKHDDDYNVFANDRQHPEQPESVNDTYPDEEGDNNIIIDSLDITLEKYQSLENELSKRNTMSKSFAALQTKQTIVVPISTRKPKRTMNQFVATSLKKTVASESTNQKPRSTTRKQYEYISKTCKWWYSKITPPGYKWKPKTSKVNVIPNLIEIIMFIVDSGMLKEHDGKFGNDQIAPILSYGDLKSTCYIRDLKGNDLLTGSRGTDLYSIFLQNATSPNPMSEAVTTSNEMDLLFSLMFYELLNETTPVVSKSSAIHVVDAPDQRQQQNTNTSTSTTVAAETPPLNIQTTHKTTIRSVRKPADGFVDPHHPDKVYHLNKALYGLKQAPRACYDELFTFMVSKGFSKGGDKLVSWSSKKQDCTSMSSAEAVYVSLSACCAQVLWMLTQLTDYGFYFDKISMYYDSKTAIAISCNLVQHSRTKHIDLADPFTKALPEDKFKYLVRQLGMRCLTPEELEVLANESA
ncbi:retrovirus-related pol polyprotein from transposon TNT 1-94 [Tanacetum coccineum]